MKGFDPDAEQLVIVLFHVSNKHEDQFKAKKNGGPLLEGGGGGRRIWPKSPLLWVYINLPLVLQMFEHATFYHHLVFLSSLFSFLILVRVPTQCPIRFVPSLCRLRYQHTWAGWIKNNRKNLFSSVLSWPLWRCVWPQRVCGDLLRRIRGASR